MAFYGCPHIVTKYQSELLRLIPGSSMESDHICTLMIHFDNVGENADVK